MDIKIFKERATILTLMNCFVLILNFQEGVGGGEQIKIKGRKCLPPSAASRLLTECVGGGYAILVGMYRAVHTKIMAMGGLGGQTETFQDVGGQRCKHVHVLYAHSKLGGSGALSPRRF